MPNLSVTFFCYSSKQNWQQVDLGYVLGKACENVDLCQLFSIICSPFLLLVSRSFSAAPFFSSPVK